MDVSGSGSRIQKLVGSINNQLGINILQYLSYHVYHLPWLLPFACSAPTRNSIHFEDAAMNCEERLDDLRSQSVLAPMEMAVSCLETIGEWLCDCLQPR